MPGDQTRPEIPLRDILEVERVELLLNRWELILGELRVINERQDRMERTLNEIALGLGVRPSR